MGRWSRERRGACPQGAARLAGGEPAPAAPGSRSLGCLSAVGRSSDQDLAGKLSGGRGQALGRTGGVSQQESPQYGPQSSATSPGGQAQPLAGRPGGSGAGGPAAGGPASGTLARARYTSGSPNPEMGLFCRSCLSPDDGPWASRNIRVSARRRGPHFTLLDLRPGLRWFLQFGRQSGSSTRSEEHTSELQSRQYLVCRLLLEKKKKITYILLTN